MTSSLRKAVAWGVFAAAAGVLVAACTFKLQTYEFNRFLLVLIAVPPVMLGVLMCIVPEKTQAGGKRQP
ncbi:MAG: hypothetical protein AB7U38_00990 [Hyphomicrobiales bacterium]